MWENIQKKQAENKPVGTPEYRERVMQDLQKTFALKPEKVEQELPPLVAPERGLEDPATGQIISYEMYQLKYPEGEPGYAGRKSAWELMEQQRIDAANRMQEAVRNAQSNTQLAPEQMQPMPMFR